MPLAARLHPRHRAAAWGTLLLLSACVPDGPGAPPAEDAAAPIVLDAGRRLPTPDATTPDAGPGLDVGPSDAGAWDAAPGVDAGASPDAGSMADAGTAPDAGPPCPACGAHAHCDLEHEACVCDEGASGDPIAGCVPDDAPRGFVGSPCQADADCDFAGGRCATAGQGWPGGHCTVECSRLCPDRAGHPVTFCVDTPGGTGACVSRCDTAIHPGGDGCRSGYACSLQPRRGEAATTREACVPEAWLPPPMACADPRNPGFDDDCYLDAVAWGDAAARADVEALLEGRGTAAIAERWLDANHAASRAFILDGLASRIHDNFTAGHRADQPMRGMIVHYTANQREDATIRYFVGSAPHASTHFVLGSHRNGLVVQLYSHRNRTWHAGSTYNVDRFGLDFANAGYLVPRASGGFEDYAGRAYTTELEPWGDAPIEVTGGIPGAADKYGRHTLWQPYSAYQLLSFVLVGRALHLVYGLERAAVERHGDVASSRVDPGPALPLTALLDLVFDGGDALAEPWLQAWRVDPRWIQDHPEAR